MARNKWTETCPIVLKEIDGQLQPVYGEPYRYTMSLGFGLIRIAIHKIDPDWAEMNINESDREGLCKKWRVSINRKRYPSLDSEDTEQARTNCMEHIRNNVLDLVNFLTEEERNKKE